MAIFTVNTASSVVDPEDDLLSLPESINAALDNADTDDVIRFAEGLANVRLVRNFIDVEAGHSLLIDGDTDGDSVPDITFVPTNEDGRFFSSAFIVSGGGETEFRNLGFDGFAIRPVNSDIAAGVDSGAFGLLPDGTFNRNTSLSGTDGNRFVDTTLAVIKGRDSDVTLTRVSFTDIEIGDLDGTHADNNRGGDGADGRGGVSGRDGDNSEDGSNGRDAGGGGNGGDAVQNRGDAAPIIQDGGVLTLRDVTFGGDGRAVGMEGGRGGDGGNGGRGGNGGDGGDNSIIPGPGDGGDGGDGGAGGSGGDGGPGGWASNGIILIDDTILNDLTPIAWGLSLSDSVSAGAGGRAGQGGSGGAGGSGGSGGEGFLFFSDGADGDDGSAGRRGSDGTAGDDGFASTLTQVLVDGGSAGFRFFNTLFYAAQDVTRVDEGQSVSIPVLRGGDTNFDVEVPWQVQGPGTAAIDGPHSGVLRFFAGGANTQHITLDTLNDNMLGPDVDLTLTLGTPARVTDGPETVGLGTVETLLTVEDLTTATTGDDAFTGSPADDFLDLLDGDDVMTGQGGDDTLLGGLGNDTLNGGFGFDLLEGGGGDDLVQGGGGFDTLNGGAGNDTLQGNFGNDELNGGDGDDELQGGVGFDLMRGDAGADLLVGRDGFDTLEGGSGNDTLQGNAGNDSLSGGDDDDHLIGGIGSDVMNGDAGNDLLEGQGGFDTLDGGAGADTLQGNNSDDLLNGGDGDDLLQGGLANDVLNGDAGNDTLEGGNGFDLLNGGDGDDRLEGNAGNDTLDGGAGNDVLRGGLGADTFVFRVGSGNDRIVDKGIVDSVALDAGLLGGGSPDPADLGALSSLDGDGFLLLDFGNGDTLTFTGITEIGAILDDVSFI